MEHYRIRWMPNSYRYCIELRVDKKAFGFWPVHRWELKGFANTLAGAQDFILMMSKG